MGFTFSFTAFRYEDFFGGKKEKGSKRKEQLLEKTKDFDDKDDMESDKQVSLCVSRFIQTHDCDAKMFIYF